MTWKIFDKIPSRINKIAHNMIFVLSTTLNKLVKKMNEVIFVIRNLNFERSRP